jgi:hypothetical protein
MALNHFSKHAVTVALGLALLIPAAALKGYASQDRDQDRQGQRNDRDQDRNDRDRHNGRDQDYANSKYYKKGMRDGGHDRDKHRSERGHNKHFKNDRDRQAYEAGYEAGYRGDRHWAVSIGQALRACSSWAAPYPASRAIGFRPLFAFPDYLEQAQSPPMSSEWRCQVSVSWAYDPTGQNGDTCGAACVSCDDCGGPAGCHAHAQKCMRCGDAVCEGCAEQHACEMIFGGKAA